jgi:DNA-binding response OmpR family regulator
MTAHPRTAHSGARDESWRGARLNTVDESRYILVVDDDASICDLIAEILSDEGYEVTTTRDPARALTMIAQRPPALILLDLSVADQSAEELVAAIRRLPGQTISIIVVSAHTNVRQRAEEVGADGYLPKPFDVPILLDTVQAILSVRRGGEQSGSGGPEAW